MKSLLLSWAGAGAVVAAATAGYVGVTAAQVVAMATADDASVVAVADPPARVPHPTGPAAAAPTPTVRPLVVAPSATRSSAEPKAERPAPEPAPEPEARPATPADRGLGRPAAPTRGQRLEIKHARWADRQLAAMLRTTSRTMQWFGGAAWTTPVADYHLTARFGETSSLWATIHTGLDFAAPTGTPVRAATAGTVTSVGWAGAYGNKIEITQPDGSETWYAHLSRTDVRVGAEVATGAVIGAVGATGNVTGSHLHFEVRPGGGSPVDPETALREHGVRP